MAFIFNPNPSEGDKQTNDETGVEYIFTDGAWRPLGPKIEDQFDELDERYVNVDGDVMHGTLKFDHGADGAANILIRPNISNVSTSIYQLNGGALRFRSLPGEDLNDGSTSHIAIGKNETDGTPETYIYHLQDPDGPLHAVNLQYLERYVAEELGDVDLSGYLPLTGGSMTGAIQVDRESGAGLELFKEGTSNLKLWVDGGITTTKTTFNDDQLVTKDYVDTADGILGTMITLNAQDSAKKVNKTGDTMTGELKINIGNPATAIRLQQDGTDKIKLWNTNSEARLQVFNGQVFKVTGYVNDTITQLFGVSSTGTVTLANLRTPTAYADAATKNYADYPRRPPGLRFLYTLEDPVPAEKFRIYTSNNTKRMQISGTCRDFKWLSTNPQADMRFDEGHRYTIYYDDGNNGWRVKKTGTYNKVDYHANDIVVHFSSELNSDPPLNPNAGYVIHLAGMF